MLRIQRMYQLLFVDRSLLPSINPLEKAMKYSNWKEYVNESFNGDEFTFEDKINERFGTFNIKSNISTCCISFIWPSNEWKEIDDVQYYSSETAAWSGEFIGSNPHKFGKLTPENIERLNNFLKIPLEMGWTSEELQLFGKTLKRTSYELTERKNRILTELGGDLGCLTYLLFWPLLWLVNILIKRGFIGTRKLINVEPMKKYAR